MALATYNKKRSFNKTPEPKGKIEKKVEKQLHFVVQKHDASRLHYDFRLELDGVLKSWAIPKGPSLDPEVKRLAMQVEDHPLSYMKFEGEIPKGNYGAGDVIVWDIGLYTEATTADPDLSRKKLRSGLEEGKLKFVLYGEKLKGGFTLVKIKTEENAWLLIKERDEFAKKTDILTKTESPLSNKVLPRDEKNNKVEKSKRRSDPMPHDIKPMLSKLSNSPFDRENWIFEIKWDGYRAITEVKNGKIKIYSRNNLDFNLKYPEIVDVLKKYKKHDCILDGEIIAIKGGKSDFHTLQKHSENKAELKYVVFDLLYLDGEDLRDRPLLERKEKLKKLIADDKDLLFSEHVKEKGKEFFKNVQKNHLEGIIAKDENSPYLENTRSNSWLKIKNINEQEAIIIGFTKPRGGRQHFGALVLGAYVNKKLKYIGHSGGGFTGKELAQLSAKLKKISISKSPIEEKVPINSPITWVKPILVCQIKFTEWTPSGRMRHPIYEGLRVDKKADEVTKEIPGNNTSKTGVKFTNLEKVYWPKEGYTKGDLIEYYEKMSDFILPYLKDKPENLLRHPNGIVGSGFFQKDITFKVPDFVKTKKIWSESNKAYLNYILCQNKETLLYLANLGCIELNPWNSKINQLDKPDYMIIDLDPDNNSFEDVIVVANETHKVLKLICAEHYIKTSGKTGLHICIPFGGRYTYEQLKSLALIIVKLIHNRLPDITSIERDPKKRRGKIYLDYLQNRRGQTLASVYSLRPYKNAPVSTPLEWSEVKKGLDPKDFNMKTIWKRLEKKGDLWKPVLENRVNLEYSLKCLEDHFKIKNK